MSPEDFERIQTELSCRLPKSFKKLLLNRTKEIAELKELMPLMVVPWTDADEIIDENQSARRNPDDKTISEKRKGSRPWPEEYFVVGTNGAADYWFIDLSRELWHQGIWFYSHEAESIEPHYDNFGAWLGELREAAKNPGEWQ